MKKNKGFAPVIVLLIMLGVLAVGGGAYYLKTKNNSIPNNVQENNQLPEKLNDVVNTPDQKNQENNTTTKGYLTYTNTSYKYRFDYPSSRFNKFLDSKTSKSISINDGDCVSRDCATLYKVIVKDNVNNLTDLKALMISDLGAVLTGGCESKPTWTTNSKIDGKQTIQLDFFSCGANYNFKTQLGTIYNGKGYIISFVGMYGGEYKGDMKSEFDNVVSSFKFLDTEESLTETFKNQPGTIKSITANGSNKWILAVDLLSGNPKWLPGADGIAGEFFINQNTKIRNLNVTKDTKIYDCGIQYADGTNVEPRLQNNSSFLSNIQNTINKAKTDPGLLGEFGYTAYFDINGTNITAMYQQCLP